MEHSAKPLLTLSGVRDLYVGLCARAQGNTKQKVRSVMDLMIECLGDAVAGELDELAVPRFQTWLAQRVTNRQRRMSPASVRSYCAAASQAFGFAVRTKQVAANPFDGADKIKPPRRAVRYYRGDAVQAILRAAATLRFQDPTANLRWTGIAHLGLAGMRRGAVCNLRWEDLVLEPPAGMIPFVWVRYRPDLAGSYWEWGDKGGADYAVPLTQDLLECLYRLQVVCPWRYPLLPEVTCRAKQARVLTLTESQKKDPYNNFRRTWRRILRAAKISAGTFHELRKTAGTVLNREGVTLATAQELLGHKDEATTRACYTAVEREHCLGIGRAAFDRAYRTHG
jgi:integrase